jgi:RND family efflux transporter MFP subunit
MMRTMPYVAVGISGYIGWQLFGAALLPAVEVEVVSVIATEEAEVAVADGGAAQQPVAEFTAEVAFQAPGWLEAFPYPVRTAALVSGVIASVEVLEGQMVEKGQVLSRLIAEDFVLAVQQAEAGVRQAEAALVRQQRVVTLEQARLGGARQRLDAAQGRTAELADLYQRAVGFGDGFVAEQEVEQARLRLATQRSQQASAAAVVDEHEAQLLAAEAHLQELEAALALQRTALATARLAQERTIIRAPVSGRIQRLLVSPGMKRMLNGDKAESATVAVLYDPAQMQARIDVPVADAASLHIGQAVVLQTEMLPGMEFRGVVDRIDGQADLTRNTLQAKVRLLDNDPRLRPELLCRAKFLQSAGRSGGGGAEELSGTSGVRLLLPIEALVDAGTAVWRINQQRDRVVRTEVVTVAAAIDGHVEVRSGLLPGDLVALALDGTLQDGDRVRIINYK